MILKFHDTCHVNRLLLGHFLWRREGRYVALISNEKGIIEWVVRERCLRAFTLLRLLFLLLASLAARRYHGVSFESGRGAIIARQEIR